MPVILSTGTFLSGTGAGATTISVTGVVDQNGNAFDPTAFSKKVLLLWCSGRVTSLGQSETDYKWGSGYAISTTDRGCNASQSDYSNTTMATDSAIYDDACLATLTIAGGVDGKFDFDAWLSNGFRLIVDDAFANSYEINYLIITGSDLLDAESVTLSISGTGDQNVTSLSFSGESPTLALLFGAGSQAINAIQVNSKWSFGACDSALNNYVIAGFSIDGAGNAGTCSHSRSGVSYAQLGLDSVAVRGSITAWLGNGFTFNTAEAAAGTHLVRVLCLRGVNAALGDLLTATSLTTIAETVPTDPQGALIVSHCKAVTASDTTSVDDERSMGAVLLNKTQNYASIIDKDAAATADCGVATNTTGCYANQSTATSIAIEGVMGARVSGVAFDPAGTMTLEMTDADPAQAFVWYVVFSNKRFTGSGAVTTGAATASGAATFTAALAFTGAGAATIGAATASGAATFAPGTKTGVGAVTVGNFPGSANRVQVAGTATFTAPVYAGVGAATVGAATASGAATFTVPTYTGAGAATAGATTASGAATFTAPIYAGAGAATAKAVTAAGAATFVAPIYAAVGAVTMAPALTSGSASFTIGSFTGAGAVTAGIVSASGSATFTAPIYAGVGVATVRAATAAGAGTFTAPIYTGAGAVTARAATASGTGIFAVGVFSGQGAVTSRAATTAGSATFVAPTYAGVGTATAPRATTSGAATFVAPVYTGDGAVTVEAVVCSGSATSAPPTFIGVGAATIGAVVCAGSATFVPTFTGAGAATVPAALASGVATFGAGIKTALGAVSMGRAVAQGTATFVQFEIIGFGDSWESPGRDNTWRGVYQSNVWSSFGQSNAWKGRGV